MKGSYRKRVAQNVRDYILYEMPELAALLAEFDALEREVETLREENEELRKKAFRLNEDLPGEVWRDLVGYEGVYQVSNFVRFKSFHRGRVSILLPYEAGRYSTVCLVKNGVGKTVAVHRVVALAFVPNPDPVNKTDVHHINNNKHDNRPENLMWVTTQENVRYAWRDGLGFANRSLSVEQVRCIRANLEGLTQASFAERFGVSVATIAGVQNGRYYRDVK